MLDEGFQPTRVEAAPVSSVLSDDDRRLEVSETLDLVQRLRIARYVHNPIFDRQSVQFPVSGSALDASGLGVDSDQNGS